MNKILITSIIFFNVVTINTTYAQQNIRDKFLVDKIYFTDGMSEYLYDEENNLIKVPWGFFEYKNGLVSKFLYRHPTQPQFDSDEHYFYDSQGQLVRREKYFKGQMLSYLNFHYENGLMVSTYSDTTLPFQGDSIFYDTSGNVVKHSRLWEFGWRTIYYEYDNNPKPNFGIDYLFMFLPFPCMGTIDDLGNLERGLSKNNMTKIYWHGGILETYNYTYNEHGLPVTFETVYSLGYSMLLNISYKQIEVGVPKLEQNLHEIKVYPNPTDGQLRITNYELRIEGVEVFDIYGKMQKAESRRQKTESEIVLDISNLAAGIYFVKVVTEKGEVIKKVVKQ